MLAVVCGLIPFSAAAADGPKPGLGSAESSGSAGKPRRPEFEFNGGSFEAFVRQLRKHYGTNVLELFEIPDGAWDLRVPKMKVPDKFGDAPADLRGTFEAYNQISESGDWFLGKWSFHPRNPINAPFQAMVFFPPKNGNNQENGGIAVRAFSVRGISPADREKVVHLIRTQADLATYEFRNRRERAGIWGSVDIHEPTELLVAKGSKSFVEMAGSLVDAFLSGSPARH